MKIKRRDFLKGLAGSAVLGAAGSPGVAAASEKERIDTAKGMLLDSTLCIGCQSCMVACKKANDMPYEFTGNQRTWDNPQDLSSKTLNVIKKYSSGTGVNKDQETDGYAFVKRHCMHCVDPACCSGCPVGALKKDPVSGAVTYNKDRCIGCRYCQIACPYNIPKFQWLEPFPRIVKCQLCDHLLKQGEISACCGTCPTGASLFGPVDELLAEARRRQEMVPGETYRFPITRTGSGVSSEKAAARYIPKIYGEKDGGGTQILMLAGVPFDKLGLPALPEKSYAAIAENIQHSLYKGMLLPIAVFGGLIYMIRRNRKSDEAGKKQDPSA